VNVRLDPVVNFKLKQRLRLLGACVTLGMAVRSCCDVVIANKSNLNTILLGMDYLSDLGHWRSYCAIEDTLVRGS
jgi:predicted aspartyl protease